MATAAEAAAYRQAQRDVVTLARADLVAWWRTLDVSDARAATAALQAFVPDLVAAYGDTAATVAADYFDQLRAEAATGGRAYRAVVAQPVPVGQAQASARWAAGPLFGAQPDSGQALRLLAGAVQRLVQQAGRDTLARNIARDPSRPRWARVPGGLTPCAFCRMVASRGAVYLSAESAGMNNRWHDDCTCQPVAVWQGQELPYDADALYEQYLAARAEAGGSTKAILSQLRQDLGTN